MHSTFRFKYCAVLQKKDLAYLPSEVYGNWFNPVKYKWKSASALSTSSSVSHSNCEGWFWVFSVLVEVSASQTRKKGLHAHHSSQNCLGLQQTQAQEVPNTSTLRLSTKILILSTSAWKCRYQVQRNSIALLQEKQVWRLGSNWNSTQFSLSSSISLELKHVISQPLQLPALPAILWCNLLFPSNSSLATASDLLYWQA